MGKSGANGEGLPKELRMKSHMEAYYLITQLPKKVI